MSLVMAQIESEHPELFAFEFGKIAESDFVYTLAYYKCRPISTKHGHNIYDNEFLDEFDYQLNPTVTAGVICP